MQQLKKVPGLYNAVQEILARERNETRTRLDKIDKAWSLFRKDNSEETVTFEVTLRSLWSNEGESDVSSKSRRGLRQAIRRAQTRFKKINNRSDIQARYYVRVYFGTTNQFSVLVPEVHYKDMM